MIKLSNGHQLEFVAASGSLAFDGRGWPWEWPLRWAGLINPHLFTVITKTILLYPRRGNLRWFAPWRVLKFVSNEGKAINPILALTDPSRIAGVLNAVDLTGPGFEHWIKKDLPTIQRLDYGAIVSITGTEKECVEMAKRLNGLGNIKGIEYDSSCPSNMETGETTIKTCLAIQEVSRLPLLLKLSYAQPYLEIAKETEGIIEAISINTVPWRIVFPDRDSPLAEYGGGGVSGKIAQPFTWQMIAKLARETSVPVIGPSIWEYEDIQCLKMLGASAYHFGTIFLPYPWRPTKYVKRWIC